MQSGLLLLRILTWCPSASDTLRRSHYLFGMRLEIWVCLQASQAAKAQKRQRKSVLADEPAEEPKAASKTIFDDWDDCDVTV